MPLIRRVSLSSYPPQSPSTSTGIPQSPINASSEFQQLCTTLAKDIKNETLFEIDVDVSVDAACDSLLEKDISCLAVRSLATPKSIYVGLFDCSDVNAFLTLAATSHLLNDDEADSRVSQILEAAKSGTGKVPVRLCTDLSEKNPLSVLPATSTVSSLLQLFSQGTHRVIIENAAQEGDSHMASDMGVVQWFMEHATENTALASVLTQSLTELRIGSHDVISCSSSDTVLDAMKLLSEQGLSSLAVTDTENGDLLSAISVTDITRLVAPSQSKKILSMPLGQFIALVKAPGGSQDGVDRYPVFSASQSSTLSHIIQKLLATHAHRVFITDDPAELNSPKQGNLRGVVSVVDVLSVFAKLAGIPNVDPTRMQRHRRASSASSSSSRSASRSRVSRRSSVLSSVRSEEKEGREIEKK